MAKESFSEKPPKSTLKRQRQTLVAQESIAQYFGFLKHLDTESKKELIVQLTDSIQEGEKSTVRLQDLAGAWDDSRDSDEIIREIRNSRNP